MFFILRCATRTADGCSNTRARWQRWRCGGRGGSTEVPHEPICTSSVRRRCKGMTRGYKAIPLTTKRRHENSTHRSWNELCPGLVSVCVVNCWIFDRLEHRLCHATQSDYVDTPSRHILATESCAAAVETSMLAHWSREICGIWVPQPPRRVEDPAEVLAQSQRAHRHWWPCPQLIDYGELSGLPLLPPSSWMAAFTSLYRWYSASTGRMSL